MMTSESGPGWSRPHEYIWPRWSRQNGYDDRYDLDYARQGRWLDPHITGYERSRRYNGDWMRESPWLRDPSMREPWMRESHWARSEMDGAPVVRVIEINAQSPHSWEDATRRLVAEASHTLRGIRSISIQDMQAVVDDDHVVGFRIHAKVSFVLEDERRRR